MNLLEFTDQIYRNFKHPDGSEARVVVSDCRLEFYCRIINGKTSNGGGTKHSIEDARSIASKNVRKWLKAGFVEIENSPAIQFDYNANIIDVYRSVPPNKNSTTGNPLFNFLPVFNEPNLYKNEPVIINDIPMWSRFLLCSDNMTKGISFTTARIDPRENTSNTISTRDEFTDKLTTIVKKHKTKILSDSKTPVRKIKLSNPLDRFTHLAVLSPTVYNVDYPGIKTIGRSVWLTFPCFDSELNNNDSVSTGDARVKGRNSIKYTDWNRKAHSVFDLRKVKDINKPEKDPFLIYERKESERLLSTRELSRTRYAAIDARNYKGEIRRFLPNQIISEADMVEIHNFFTE